MTGWTAQVRGAENLTPEMREAYHRGLLLAAEALGIEGQRFVQENINAPFNGKPPAVFTTNLLQSVTPQVIDDQAMVRLVIGVAPSMGANAYAAPVETGARPHFPPSSVLVPWVKRKLGIEDDEEAKSVAFVIARAIAKRGTRGHEMFSRALPQLEAIAVPVIERNLAMSFAQAGFGGTASG